MSKDAKYPPDVKIEATLTPEEADVIWQILDKEASQRLLMARLHHSVGEIADSEMEWWEGHSSWLHQVIRKLFPEYKGVEGK